MTPGGGVTVAPKPSPSEPSIEPSSSPSGSNARAREAFETFWDGWQSYDMPKGNKQKAREAWDRHVVESGTDPPLVIERALAYCAQCRGFESKTAHVVTWINQHGWEQEYETPTSTGDQVEAAIDEMVRRKDAGQQHSNQGDSDRQIAGGGSSGTGEPREGAPRIRDDGGIVH
ncbi:MAG: hypothetical protein ACR2PS_18470 [Pseudomonadales bacterium]